MFACSVSSAAASPATADFSISLFASIPSHSHQVTGLAPAYGRSLFPMQTSGKMSRKHVFQATCCASSACECMLSWPWWARKLEVGEASKASKEGQRRKEINMKAAAAPPPPPPLPPPEGSRSVHIVGGGVPCCTLPGQGGGESVTLGRGKVDNCFGEQMMICQCRTCGV